MGKYLDLVRKIERTPPPGALPGSCESAPARKTAQRSGQRRSFESNTVTTLTTETTKVPAKAVVCFVCHERHFWRSIHGGVVCRVCNPPLHSRLVAEWLSEPAEGE